MKVDLPSGDIKPAPSHAVALHYPMIPDSTETYLTHSVSETYVRAGLGLCIVIFASLVLFGIVLATGSQITSSILFVIPFLILCQAVMRSSTIKMGAGGFDFPLLFAFSLGGKLHRQWSEIEAVSIRRGSILSDRVGSHVLQFEFRDKHSARMELNRFRRAELIQMIQTFHQHCEAPDINAEMAGVLSYYDFELGNKARYINDIQSNVSALDCNGFTATSTFQKGDLLKPDLKISKVVSANREVALFQVVDAHGQKCLVHEFDCTRLSAAKFEVLQSKIMADRGAVDEHRAASGVGLTAILDTFVRDKKFYVVSERGTGLRLDAVVCRLHPLIRAHMSKKITSNLARALLNYETAVRLHEEVAPRMIVAPEVVPADIFVQIDGSVQVTPVGFVRSALRSVCDELHYPEFLAPEQLRGDDHRNSIVFNLACVASYIYTGYPPDVANTRPAAGIKDGAFAYILASMFEVDPSKRPNLENVTAMLRGEPQ